jgi:hypothetical protein
VFNVPKAQHRKYKRRAAAYKEGGAMTKSKLAALIAAIALSTPATGIFAPARTSLTGDAIQIL